MAALTGLFAPDRVAVVGATDRAGSLGRALLENLTVDFAGELVGVNPNHDDVLGVPCVPALGDTDGVDLEAVVETIQRVSLLAVEFPSVRELDVNPLVATPDGVVAVDFRATLDAD